jgi:hypothetical protein
VTERKSKPRARTPSPNPPTEYSMIQFDEVRDAVMVLGSVRRALDELGMDRGSWYRLLRRHPHLATELRAAQDQAKDARILWLEGKLDGHIEDGNLVATFFALKREDPSYRESYNVTTTNAPTDYVIDLSTDDPAQLADVTPARILGE